MVKKVHTGNGSDSKASAQFAGTVKESASQIWLAGLGAFSKAQEEGGKVFEALVKEGLGIQRKTQAAAGEKMSEAASRMASMADELSSKAAGRWDKLESIFEDRVARALSKLGVPSAKDIDALVARIDELNRTVSGLGARRPAAKAAKAPRKAATAKARARPAAKKRPARKTA